MLSPNASALVDHYLAPPDPHETYRIEGFAIFTFIAAVVTLIVESWTVYALMTGGIGLVTALLIHAIVSGLLVLGYVLFTPLANNHLFMGVLMLAVIPLGPVGAAGALLTMLLWLWFSLFSAPFSEWFKTIFPSPVITLPESLDEDIRTGRDEAAKTYDVEPFMDVLRYGSDDQKRRALSKITSFFSPGFAPALRLALQDESNMIRVQAATAISMIENRFQARLMKLERVYKQYYKDDPAVVLALANYLDDYAFTGILDDARERSNRERAKALFEEYLAAEPDNGIVRTRYGRLLLRLGKTKEAIAQFLTALENAATPTRFGWLAEAYFRNGDYAQLRQLAKQLQTEYPEVLQQMERSVHDSLMSWLPQAPDATKEA